MHRADDENPFGGDAGGGYDSTSGARESDDAPARCRERVDANEVTSALDFLASPRLAVVERPSRGYRAIASAHTALQ